MLFTMYNVCSVLERDHGQVQPLCAAFEVPAGPLLCQWMPRHLLWQHHWGDCKISIDGRWLYSSIGAWTTYGYIYLISVVTFLPCFITVWLVMPAAL